MKVFKEIIAYFSHMNNKKRTDIVNGNSMYKKIIAKV